MNCSINIKDGKTSLHKDSKKNEMVLTIIIKQNSEDKVYFIYFEYNIMSEKEIIHVLIEEINEIKNQNCLTNSESNENKDIEKGKDIKSLENELKKIDDGIIKMNNRKEEIKKLINENRNNMNSKTPESTPTNSETNKVKNQIIIQLEVDEKNKNQSIDFLNNYNNDELSEDNVTAFINGLKSEYHYYFYPKKIGFYTIILKFKKSLTNCEGMFNISNNLIKSIDFSNFNSQNVKNMKEMFRHCVNLKKINLISFDTKNVENMEGLFEDCTNLEDINLSSFNTNKVKNLQNMFSYCKNLKLLDLSYFKTKRVEKMSGLFQGCENLVKLDLSSFSYENVESLKNIFKDCYSLKNIKLNKNSEKIRELIDERFVQIIY